MSLILVGGMVILMLLGVEVFAAVGVVAAIGLVLFLGQSLRQLPFTGFDSMNSFLLTAVPLFILMGGIFANTGVIRSLFDATDKWMGNFPGGTVMSVIAANAVFGAMCASTFAATATFGKICYPDMERLGVSPRLSLGAIAVGGILSAAIPPSAILIVYGAYANASVPRLFAAVIVPGIILTLLLMITVLVWIRIKPSAVPKSPKYSWGQKLKALGNLLPWLGIIVLILGAIFSGIMTPTEVAALGVVLSILLAMAYRRMSFKALKESMWGAIRITSMAALLIFTSKVLGQVLAQIGVTSAFSYFLLGLPVGKYGVLAIIGLGYLIGGCFMADWPLMLLTLPFILPVIDALGYPHLWFGVWYILVGEVGVITPPFGLHLFILHSIVPKHSAMSIALGALPFIFPILAVAILITVFPEIATWLPSVIY